MEIARLKSTGCKETLKAAVLRTALNLLVADVAELADALDSKSHFYRFHGVSPRFNYSDYNPDFID